MNVFDAMEQLGWEYDAESATFSKPEPCHPMLEHLGNRMTVTFKQACEALGLAEAGVDRPVFALFGANDDAA